MMGDVMMSDVGMWFTEPMQPNVPSDAVPDGVRATLEWLSDRAVPGRERLAVGGWWARAGLGATGRANSAWANGSAGRGITTAVDEIEGWYRARNLTPRFQVFDGTDPDLVADLDGRGWIVGEASLVMAADICIVTSSARGGTSDPPWGTTVELTDRPPEAFRALVGDDARMAEVTTAQLPQRFVIVADEHHRTLGGGMTTIDGPWMAIQAMKTLPEARRRGVASAIISALVGSAVESGARHAWLQVTADNDGAIALYRKLGFEVVHGYRYHVAPNPGSRRSPRRSTRR